MFARLSVAAKGYNIAVVVAGLALLLWLLTSGPSILLIHGRQPAPLQLLGLSLPGIVIPAVFLFILSLGTSMLPVKVPAGFIVTAAAAPMFGALLALDNPAVMALIACFGTLDARQLRGELPLFKVVFNRAMLVLAYGVAAIAFHAQVSIVGPVAAGTVAALLIYVINTGLIVLAVALVTETPLRKVWTFSYSQFLVNWGSLYLIGVLFANLFGHGDVANYALVVLLLLPLFLVRFNIQQTFRLREQTYATSLSLANALDARDRSTAGHSLRVSEHSERIALELGLTFTMVDVVKTAAAVHDVGKIGVRDAVLYKTGPLNDDEWAEMRSHAMRGGEILRHHPSLAEHALIVEQHHERHSGSGYPRRLSGEQIHIGARIIGVADSFDAMTSPRPYRPRPLSPGEAMWELRAESGTLYDPRVIAAFLAAQAKLGVIPEAPAAEVQRRPAVASLGASVPAPTVSATGGS